MGKELQILINDHAQKYVPYLANHALAKNILTHDADIQYEERLFVTFKVLVEIESIRLVY